MNEEWLRLYLFEIRKIRERLGCILLLMMLPILLTFLFVFLGVMGMTAFGK